MTDEKVEQVNPDQVRLYRDLREIRRLNGHLDVQAHYAGVSRDAGGLDALHLAAPAADLSKWEDNYEAAENYALDNDLDFKAGYAGRDYAADQLDEYHPHLILPHWEDRIRTILGVPSEKKATVHDATLYLASAGVWMFDTDGKGRPNFIDIKALLSDLSKCRARLENVLKDGIRHEKTETPCDIDGCNRLLIKVYGASAALDRYKCPTHKEPLDYKTYTAIRHQHMFSAQAENAWVDISAAAKSINRSQHTIRTWMQPKASTKVPFHGVRVRSRRVGPMSRIEVYWPDVRDTDANLRRADATRKARSA